MPVFLNATSPGCGKGWRPSFAGWWSLSLAKPRRRASRALSIAPTRWTARRSCRPLGQKEGYRTDNGFPSSAMPASSMRLGRHPDLLPLREAGLSGVGFKALVAPEEGARHGGRDHQHIEERATR